MRETMLRRSHAARLSPSAASAALASMRITSGGRSNIACSDCMQAMECDHGVRQLPVQTTNGSALPRQCEGAGAGYQAAQIKQIFMDKIAL